LLAKARIGKRRCSCCSPRSGSCKCRIVCRGCCFGHYESWFCDQCARAG